MQYSANLNLLAAFQHFPELDANDLIVFDCIKKYSRSNKIKRQLEGGEMYFWFNWTVVKEQLPIIKSNSRRSIDAHIAALCNVGLLERHPDNKAKATSFYKLGANCEKLDFVEISKEDYAAKTAKPTSNEPLQDLHNLCKILPSSTEEAQPLQNSANPLQNIAKPLQDFAKVLGETFAKSCETFAKSCKHIMHIDSTVDNKLSTVDINNAREQEKSLDALASGPTIDEDFSLFDEQARNRNFLKILKIKKRFSNKKFHEKIAEFGEYDFWATIEQIENYIDAQPKAKYVDLPSAFSKWIGTAEENAAKNVFNAIWRAKHNSSYKSVADWSKAEKMAIKSIFAQLQKSIAEKANKPVAQVSKEELTKGLTMFFDKMPATRWNLDYFSLSNIARDFPQILAAIRNPQQDKPQQGETFRQKDERAQEEKRAETQQRQFTQVQKEADKAKIIRFMNAGKELTPELLTSVAYQEMFLVK